MYSVFYISVLVKRDGKQSERVKEHPRRNLRLLQPPVRLFQGPHHANAECGSVPDCRLAWGCIVQEPVLNQNLESLDDAPASEYGDDQTPCQEKSVDNLIVY